MKIIPFRKADSDFEVDLRDGIALNGIPYTWCSNLPDEQLREIYHLLLRNRFFVRRPDLEFKDGQIRVDIPEGELEYEDGLCYINVFNEKITVIYRTHEQWEAWAKAREREQEAKRRFTERKQALRDKHSALQDTAVGLLDSGQLEEAEKCLLECYRLSSDHPDAIWWCEAKFHLLRLYGLYGDPSKGLAFLLENDSTDYDHWVLAEHFSDDPDMVESVVKEGIKRFPDQGFLYKKLCLYLDRQHRFDRAIRYCKEAIHKDLTDGTKTGFPGRLQRLRKHKAKFTETQTDT